MREFTVDGHKHITEKAYLTAEQIASRGRVSHPEAFDLLLIQDEGRSADVIPKGSSVHLTRPMVFKLQPKGMAL